LVQPFQNDCLFLNGDNSDVREMFTNLNKEILKPIFGKYKIVIIDEAQRIPNAGLALKVIHDNFPDIQLIATGSSSFELANEINEPMTGRKLDFYLQPFSFYEMVNFHGFLNEKRLLNHRMIYGYYPDIALNVGNEIRLLKSLASSYLYKDILILGAIKKPVLLEKILSALALQLGNEVSYNELSKLLSADKETIEKYIDLLEKAYIIFRIPAYSNNIRNEIKRGRKIYFFDNGIRNAILNNFQPINTRTDVGALWENFIISERIKKLKNSLSGTKLFFWRTTQQQEIDLIEKSVNGISAIELKWNPKKNVIFSKTFLNAYPEVDCKVITPENMHEFLIN
jgi:uncharacterized protein